MSSHTLLKLTVSAIALVFLSGCLMRQRVTSGGRVVEDGFVIKRPIRDALRNSR